ncbi:hypothetical protein N0V88_003909 [Collariella sp. IMI 366227]|nr:hypothetical protein N0V88_003909 [Collariella sp. IMI 366227]
MSFAIEVPGEAAPLSQFELVKALSAAGTSTDHAQRQSASQQLQTWEPHPDYYTSLQTVYLDKSQNKQVRFLAIILLKNGMDKYWRTTAKHAIRPENKHLIRSRLLQGSLDEEDRTFALHNALVTAKIVRIDYPNEWPDAFTTLIELTKTANVSNPLHLRGALLVLLRLVKELSTARLRKSQSALQAVAPALVQVLGTVYTEKTAYWQEACGKGAADEPATSFAIENSLTALKVLRRLVIDGYEQPHADPMVCGFWSLSQSQFDQFFNAVSQGSSIPPSYHDMVGKHLIQFTKLHIKMSETHPASFPVLPNSIPLVKAYWSLVKGFSETAEGSPKHEGPLYEKLALKGLLLLRSCVAIAHHPVQTFKYRSPEVKELEKQAVHTIRVELLTRDMLLDMLQVIISKLFIFRQSDLEAWEEDPEGWESQERTEGQAFEWAVRPCAERLLLDLLIHYKELGEPLLAYCNLATKVDMDIVTKEAAYCALGCAAAVIHQSFDFDKFLTTSLVKDVQIQNPMAKLLRRRIAILLSQWIPIKIAQENRSVVNDIFRHLMNPSDQHNDEVVRITAARQFKYIAEDFEFNGEAFRLPLLETLRVIVTRMETHISQFGDALMVTLPKIWESTGTGEYMIKQSILAIMSALVSSMRIESQRYQGEIIPLLREAMNPESPFHLHLMEESVDLWKTVLTQSSPPLNPDLTQMVQLALPLLQYNSAVAIQCLEIVKDYIHLAPQDILSDVLRRPTLAALAETLHSESREQSQLGVKSIELVIRGAEELGSAQGVSVVVQDLHEIGVLQTILEGLHSAWESSQTTGPKRKPSKINSIKETDYFALLARIALADPTLFVTMLSGFGSPFDQVWSWLGTQWFANFDCMGNIEREKISCLALTRLWELPSPMQELVLNRLQDYLSMWTSVVTELADGSSEEAPGQDTLIWTEVGAYEWDTPLDVQEREVAFKDPVHRVATYDFVRARLADMVQRVGGEQAFEANWAVNVDREVLAGFQRLSQPGGGIDGHGQARVVPLWAPLRSPVLGQGRLLLLPVQTAQPQPANLLPVVPSTPAPAPALPSFFSFQQGSERAQNVKYHSEASPLLGRYRAVPRPSDRTVGTGRGGGEGQHRVSDGAAFRGPGAVTWCAIPFPQYPLPGDDDDGVPGLGEPEPTRGRKVPGHGAARVQVNFWFFLAVYYSFYNLTALMWITKVFNLYSLNWWPQSLGFPVTFSVIAIVSIAAPIPIYLTPETNFLTVHNTAWISWTFVTMAMPVAIAFLILMTNERHLKLRHSLSETQRIFTTSWWTGEPDGSISRRDGRRQRAALDPIAFDSALGTSGVGFVDPRHQRPAIPVRLRRRWLPASFVRFVWFCLALSIGLLAYVIGEAYAEIYLRTLPHNNFETIIYVYGWISTVHLLDGLTGWILGGNEGERVGSYPLSWIFKLYFMLTYQTYVRALYARLRSPSQFILLQVLSSTSLIIVTPILMSAPFHWFLSVIGVNSQSYGAYQKICIRNVFIRFMAENASMLTFLGSVAVLHFGANKEVYPYFAFDGSGETGDYDFYLTFWASSITWGCELAASFIVDGLIRWIYKVSVVTEGKLDFIVWPELMPTCVAVMLHVLQNMLFSIIRLQFR